MGGWAFYFRTAYHYLAVTSSVLVIGAWAAAFAGSAGSAARLEAFLTRRGVGSSGAESTARAGPGFGDGLHGAAFEGTLRLGEFAGYDSASAGCCSGTCWRGAAVGLRVEWKGLFANTTSLSVTAERDAAGVSSRTCWRASEG